MILGMDDKTIVQHIDELVEQEHALRQEHEGTPGGLDDQRREQLQAMEVELDKAWDLLRQRRAKRAAGLDPDEAEERPEGTVEGYRQ
jgi:hypothetical protein